MPPLDYNITLRNKTMKDKVMAALEEVLVANSPSNIYFDINTLMDEIRPNRIPNGKPPEPIALAEEELERKLQHLGRFLFWVGDLKNLKSNKEYSIKFKLQTPKNDKWFIKYHGEYGGTITPVNDSILVVTRNIGAGVSAICKFNETTKEVIYTIYLDILESLAIIEEHYMIEDKRGKALIDDLIDVANRLKETQFLRNASYTDDDVKIAISLLKRHL